MNQQLLNGDQRKRLLEACLKVAEEVLFDQKPQSLKPRKNLAEQYYKTALLTLNVFSTSTNNFDPEILINAIHYIADIHAANYPLILIMHKNKLLQNYIKDTWFCDKLHDCMCWFYPTYINDLCEESKRFLNDVVTSISLDK